jgi:hypothetical protein
MALATFTIHITFPAHDFGACTNVSCCILWKVTYRSAGPGVFNYVYQILKLSNVLFTVVIYTCLYNKSITYIDSGKLTGVVLYVLVKRLILLIMNFCFRGFYHLVFVKIVFNGFSHILLEGHNCVKGRGVFSDEKYATIGAPQWTI